MRHNQLNWMRVVGCSGVEEASQPVNLARARRWNREDDVEQRRSRAREMVNQSHSHANTWGMKRKRSRKQERENGNLTTIEGTKEHKAGEVTTLAFCSTFWALHWKIGHFSAASHSQLAVIQRQTIFLSKSTPQLYNYFSDKPRIESLCIPLTKLDGQHCWRMWWLSARWLKTRRGITWRAKRHARRSSIGWGRFDWAPPSEE